MTSTNGTGPRSSTATTRRPIPYRRHNCDRQHRTFRTAAKCIWKRAEWIAGNGPYAVVAYCRVTTVTLHKRPEDALEALAAIDYMGCGGRCVRNHAYVLVAVTA